MELDIAIQLFQLVDTLDEYEKGLLEVLTRCHTQEELDRARKVIDERKQHMTENNPEFNAVMEQRKREAEQRADESKALHSAKMSEVTADANRRRSDAMMKVESARMGTDRMRSGVGDWVAKTRIKIYDPEEKQKQIEAGVGCPNPKCKDRGKNRGNTVNNLPTCMLCHHRLVPKDDFKSYNRVYWRKFNRGRKKK